MQNFKVIFLGKIEVGDVLLTTKETSVDISGIHYLEAKVNSRFILY